MSDSNDGFKTLFTFLAGAAIGAIAGALLTPKSGRELRGDVKQFADKFAEDAKGEYEKARTRAKQYGDEAKAEYDKISEKAKDLGGKAKGFAEDVKNRFRKGEEPEPTA
jgi:gas vesicle protein